VVALQDDPVAIPEKVVHMRGDDTRIGAVPHADVPFAHDEPAGLFCIMGGAEGFDSKVAYREPLMIMAGMVDERFSRCAAELQEIGQRSLGSIHRNIQVPGKYINAPDMVCVLVRNKEGFNVAGINTGPFHPQEALFCAQAGIDEE
jgi:hypothetical protein